MFSEVHGSENSRSILSAYPSSENTPVASHLNNFTGVASCEQSPLNVTPRLSKSQVGPQGSVLPQKCHKRSHSKVTDSLQDNVRAQLRNSLSRELPDRSTTEKVHRSPRWLPSQSPSLTFGVMKTPIPVTNNSSKRTCSDDEYHQVSAADLAAQYLRSGISRITPVPLVNTPS